MVFLRQVMLLTVGLGFFGVDAVSQGARAPRIVGDQDLETLIPASLSSSGALQYRNPVSGLRVAIQTGVLIPGDIVLFNAGGASVDMQAVVVGRASGVGVLEHWDRNEQTGDFSLASSTTFLSDIVGVGYTGGYLYILEASSHIIWRKQWTPSVSLGSGAWLPWLTVGHLPALASAEAGELTTASNVAGEIDYVESSLGYQLNEGSDYYTINVATAPQWEHTKFEYRPAVLEFGGASEGSSSVSVFGHSGDVVELVDLATQVTLGSVSPVSDDSIEMQLSSPLQIGCRYQVRKQGEAADDNFGFTCVRRYGKGQVFPDGTAMRPIPYSPFLYVGTPDISVRVPLRRDGGDAAAEETYAGYLAVAVRGSSGDPIIPIGATGEYLLDTPLLIPVLGFRATSGRGFVRGAMAIPNDASLAGQVLLVQFWLSDSQSNVGVSQIMGQKILGDASGGMLMASSSSAVGVQFEALRDLSVEGRLFRDRTIQRIPGAAKLIYTGLLQRAQR